MPDVVSSVGVLPSIPRKLSGSDTDCGLLYKAFKQICLPLRIFQTTCFLGKDKSA
jgi:hypothetical protein